LKLLGPFDFFAGKDRAILNEKNELTIKLNCYSSCWASMTALIALNRCEIVEYVTQYM
jgi:hypothetical protein